MATENERRAALEMIRAIADTIRDLGEVPSGHLYAQLMGTLRLDQYEQIIGMFIRLGVVKSNESHLLTWTGLTVSL